MKRLFYLLSIQLVVLSYAQGQSKDTVPEWTLSDQQYLLENLIRSKVALLVETSDLSEAQWYFKESPVDGVSIKWLNIWPSGNCF